MRFVRALCALAVLAALAVGVPWLLLHFSGSPVEAIRDLGELPNQPLTDTAVVDVLTVVAWTTWALFVASVLLEIPAAIGERSRPALRLGPVQNLARWLVASVAMTATLSAGTVHVLARPALGSMRTGPVPGGPVATLDLAPRDTPSAALPATIDVEPSAPVPTAVAPAGYRLITANRSDTVWSLAEQHLGDGYRWREIWEASRTLPQPDGAAWDRPEDLRTGWAVAVAVASEGATASATASLPSSTGPTAEVAPEVSAAAATADVPSAAAASTTEVAPVAAVPMATASVERGDTLARIAQRVYGDATRWPTLWEANRGREMGDGRALADPDEIDVGWQLLVPAPADAPAEAPPATHTVEPGDTLWDIAASAYGREDPALVTMVFEANQGVVDPAGRTLHDADVINPGMRLTLPPDPAVVAPPAPAVPTNVPPAPAGAVPAQAPPVSPSPPPAELVPLPAPDPPAPQALPPPDPATSSGLPASTSAPPVEPPAADAATTSTAPATSSPPVQVEALRRGPRLSVASATLLATGALTIIDARRRRRLQRMGPRDVLPVPDPDLIPVDAALRAGADAPGIARLDIALRALAASVRRDAADATDTGVRPELVVRHRSGRIEVHLHRVPDAPPPAPWVADGPKLWSLAPSVPTAELADAADGVPAPCPALVLLGRAGSTEIYLDLEAAGILRLDGPPDHAMALARGVLAGLAVSPLADVVRIVSTGVDAYGFTNEARVETADGPADALGRAEAAAATVRASLTAEDLTDTFALRAVARHESWEPTLVLLLQSALTPDQIATLAGLTGEGGRGLAVVTDQPVATSRWHLSVVDGRRWRLDPVGLVLEPVRLAADELADLGALLQDARAEPVALPLPPPVGAEPSDPPAPVSVLDDDPGEPYCEPEWRLQVRVMGPVDVVNGDGKIGSFEKGKALELVVWLAQHRRAPSRAAARTAMWETNVADASFNNIVSDARRTLARLADTPDGDEWIGRTNSDRLPLHPLVVTDAELIEGRLRHARDQPDAPAIEILRDSLELVRDAPYAGTGYLWPDGEGLPSNLILLVTSAATEMAQRCLRVGDIEGVFWSTSRGLRILPGHDELVCLRMQAHGANGDLAGVRKEYESYERVIVNDRWGDATPSAKVVELRNRLLRGSAP